MALLDGACSAGAGMAREPLGVRKSAHNSPTKNIARRLNRVRENLSPPTTTPVAKGKRKHPGMLRSALGLDPNAVAPATGDCTPQEKKATRSLTHLILSSRIPFAPKPVEVQKLASKVAGVKSGQGALHVRTQDTVTGVIRAYKGKIFRPHADCTELPTTHPTVKGLVVAPFTHVLCPETVVTSHVYKTRKGGLLFLQPMQHGFIDFYRYHQEWLKEPGNHGNVVDCLESLFKANPALEENFILASLSEIVMGSIDSKAANMLYNPATGQIMLCDTDIALRDVTIIDEGILVAETGKWITYLCEQTSAAGKPFSFMTKSFKSLVDKYPKVKAFLAKAHRAAEAKAAYMARPATQGLVKVCPQVTSMVEDGVSLVDKRIKALRGLSQTELSLNDLLLGQV